MSLTMADRGVPEGSQGSISSTPDQQQQTSGKSASDAGVVHKSSHPSLPPAQSTQVIQFLLARNYYLTALELLVEAQQCGRGDEVKELQVFFASRFPADELLKTQNANALDVQLLAREREERLQLCEYELRLAKEDLAEMHRRAETGITPRGSLPDDGTPPHLKRGASISKRSGDAAGTPTHGSPAAAADEDGNGPHGGGRGASAHLPSADDVQVLNGAVVSYLLKQGYKMTAMTMGEEDSATSADVGPGVAAGLEELDLWRWYSAEHWGSPQAAAAAGATAAGVAGGKAGDGGWAGAANGGGDDGLQKVMDDLREQLRVAQERAAQYQAQLADQSRRLTVATSSSPAVAASAAIAAPDSPSFLRRSVDSESGGAAALPTATPIEIELSGRTPSIQHALQRLQVSRIHSSTQPLPQSDAALNGALQQLLCSVADLLPRLMPNLTTKSRQDLLPLTQEVVSLHPDTATRAQLLATVVNLSGNPDEGQRRAIVDACAQMAGRFGASWTATELLPLCIKQETHQSAERRTLVAELLGGLAGHLDMRTQAHVVLTQLHRLSEDRMEEVRQASVAALTALLQKLSFTKSYYAVVEEMMLCLAKDTSEAICNAVHQTLLPALLAWSTDPDVISTSLLPKVVTDMAHFIRQGSAAHAASMSKTAQQQTHNAASSHLSGLPPIYDFASMPRKHANQDYQVAHQLLGLYTLLLPTLKLSALQNVPAWAVLDAAAAEAAAAALSHDDDVDAGGRPRDLHNEPSVSSSLVSICFKSSVLGSHVRLHGEDSREDEGGFDSTVGSPGADGLLEHVEAVARHEASESSPPVADMPEQDTARLFAVWVYSDQYMQWKSVQWVMQLLVPELIDAAKLVALTPETLEMRRQVARAIYCTAGTFGPGLAGDALLPLFICAAGALPAAGSSSSFLPNWDVLLPEAALHAVAGGRDGSSSGGGATAARPATMPEHLTESAMDLLPRTEEALRLSRERVLPMLLAGVAAAAGLLQPYLSKMMLMADHGPPYNWVMAALQDLCNALCFTCEFKDLRGEVLGLLEGLVQAPKPAGVSTRLCAVAVAQALIPCATEDQMRRAVLPPLMVLLSSNEAMVQAAVVWALLEIILRFRDQSKMVEQVLVVYDGILETCSHDVQLAVVAAGSRLAAAAGHSASTSATSAQQVEWLLAAAQQLTQHLTGNQAAAGAVVRSAEQQREMYGALFAVAQTIHAYDVRLPRLQTQMHATLEALHKCRSLATDAQTSALSGMLRDKTSSTPQPTSSSSAGPSSLPPTPGQPAVPSSAATAAATTPVPEPQKSEPSEFRSKFQQFKRRLTGRKDSGELPAVPPAQPTVAAPIQPSSAAFGGYANSNSSSGQWAAGAAGGGGSGGDAASMDASKAAGGQHHRRGGKTNGSSGTYSFFSDDECD